MLDGNSIVVVVHVMVDKLIVDDKSQGETVALASEIPGSRVHVHERNAGYDANQKTCYRLALEEGADLVIMMHPDYHYAPHSSLRWQP